MKVSTRTLLQTCGLAVALQLGFAGVALAHHPTIQGTAYCDYSDYNYYIDYTSTSWRTDGGPGSGNTRIDILVNDVFQESGAYTAANGYSFSGTLPATAGTSVVLTAYAADPWDNGYPAGQSSSVTVVVQEDPNCVPPLNGRFTGGGHQIRVDDISGTQVRITRGLTIHCDLLLSNNLEVNWQGNQFHMTEHMLTIQCSDSPDIDQFPPAAPLDTLIGVGTGRYNGEYGYTIEFTLVDAGEPGVNDQMRIFIYETANSGNVVLDVPLQVLSGGNLQAHYDQPHK